MNLKIYQVDAFTDRLFSGNPAAVCPLLNSWLDESIMQHIAMENNLAETALYICKDSKYHIRWFTPVTEVDLCGHATLAAAYILINYENYQGNEINFHSRSGILNIRNDDTYLTMNFPADSIEKMDLTDELKSCFNLKPLEVWKGITDYLFIFKNEEQIRKIKYDLNKISQMKARGIIITAKGKDCDFVSRFFAPQSGINEDPVTGSAHTTLTPYRSKILNKNELTAIQLSKRQGFLICRKKNERIEISGKAKLYMKGVKNIIFLKKSLLLAYLSYNII
jgi:PhzF family phenazine biosynthesis protein